MARHVYLADLFRSGGLEVIEYTGWRTRGSDRFNPSGLVEHVTVTGSNVSDGRTAGLLADGRSDLAGPLSQWGTDRAGRVHLVAAGRANHNGYGYMGNDSFGNEMFNDGYGEPLTVPQVGSAEIQAALLCRYHGWAVDRVLGHKETDPNRKIDPRNLYMPTFRTAVRWRIDNPRTDDLELTMSQYTDLKDEQRRQGALIDALYQEVIGTHVPEWGDKNPHANSISTRLGYLFGEFLGGDKADPNSAYRIKQRIFDRFRETASK